MTILIVKIRRSHDRFIFIMEIPTPGKTVFILRQGHGRAVLWLRDNMCKYVILSSSQSVVQKQNMITSPNGNIFRVTGTLCWEFTGHRFMFIMEIPHLERPSLYWDVEKAMLSFNCVITWVNMLFCHPVNRLSNNKTWWWRHQIETFSALLTLCAGDSPVTGEFPSQRPVMRSFDVFFNLCLNERLSKQS